MEDKTQSTEKNTQTAEPVQSVPVAATEQAPSASTVPESVGQPVAAGQTKAEDDEKFFAAIGYFAFLFIVPLIVKPKSNYCKFHAKQSMVLFLVAIFVLVVLAAVPWFGSLLTMALFAVYVLAIYKAYKGDMWNIPVISTFAGKLNLNALYGKAGLTVSSISGLKEKAESLADKAAGTVKKMGDQEASTPAEQPAQEPTPPAAPVNSNTETDKK